MEAVEESVSAARVTAALERARSLLGPDMVPALDADEGTDEATLEERVDGALTELRGLVMSYSGPDALDVVRAAYELADLERLMRLRAIDRRVGGLSAVQRALAELRAVGSVELMVRRCTQVVCERCGFDRAIMYRVEGNTVSPASAFDRRDADWEAKVKHFAEKIAGPVLDDMLLETDMLRRRAPAIVHDAQQDPRTYKPWVGLSQVRSYVAAPIAPGRTRDRLPARQRPLPTPRGRHRRPGHSVGVCRGVRLRARAHAAARPGAPAARTNPRTPAYSRRARQRDRRIGAPDRARRERRGHPLERPLPAGGSRIHSLLTAREIEVMELLVHGSTNKQIAERFVVTEGTVKAHVTHIYRKLHASNRAEAVHRYMRLLALDHQ